jgi:hypothetical protein
MADKTFVDDNVLLILNTGKVLTTYTTLKIKYQDPDGNSGNWAATLHPTNNRMIEAVVQFNQQGIWKVQAFVSNITEKFHGLWAEVKVYSPIGPDTTMIPTTIVPTTPGP